MTVCTRCHRPLKRPTPTGMGPVCSKAAQPVPDHERDLFGYEVEKAVAAARYRLGVHIESLVAEAQMVTKHAFRRARVALGLWTS